jgi:phenylalanyl-tRNA synthetase beta chain
VAQRLRLGNHQRSIELENPMSSEQSRLRTTLLGSLLDVARHNRSRGADALRLFEAGAVYLPSDDRELPHEPYHVGAILIGPRRPPSWRDPAPPSADFFAAKGVLHGLLDALRAPWSVSASQASPEPFLHPGCAATIEVDGKPAGWLGEIHPLVAAAWDLRETIAAFELDLDAVPVPPIATYSDVTSFPEVREDLAVIVSDDVTAQQVLDTIRRAGSPLLADAAVFDVYRDAQSIGAGNVSLALRLTYRAPDRTLTDEEVAKQRAAITEALAGELDGRIRGA